MKTVVDEEETNNEKDAFEKKKIMSAAPKDM